MSFEIFWGHYVRKIKKKDARRMWDRLTPENKQRALAAIIEHAKHWEEKSTEMQYIPHAASWLNGERWEDVLTETKQNWKLRFIRGGK